MERNRTFKRVPAVDKCFGVLSLIANSGKPLSLTEISNALNYNKSTVFNILHTLSDLEILDQDTHNRFRFGSMFYTLSRSSERDSDLIRVVHPYLQEIQKQTKLSTFLEMRAGPCALIVDKVDSSQEIKVSYELGMKIPLFQGAGGKAILSLLPDDEVDKIFVHNGWKSAAAQAFRDIEKFREILERVREDGIAFESEEYIQGICSFAVPLKTRKQNFQAAISVVGLKSQFREHLLAPYSELLKAAAKDVEVQLFSFEFQVSKAL